VVLEAGSTLILDEYGDLKFNVANKLPPPQTRNAKDTWNRRLQYLWDEGYLSGANRSSSLAAFHLQRALTAGTDAAEELQEKQLRASEGWT
jgi:hypothetical protein